MEKVILYSTPVCPYCVALKSYLEELGKSQKSLEKEKKGNVILISAINKA